MNFDGRDIAAMAPARVFGDLQRRPGSNAVSFLSRTGSCVSVNLFDIDENLETSIFRSSEIAMGYPGTFGAHAWVENGASLVAVTRDGRLVELNLGTCGIIPLVQGEALGQVASSASGKFLVASGNDRKILLGSTNVDGTWNFRSIFEGVSGEADHFVADPTISTALGAVAFRFWHDSTMPWYQSRIKIVDFAGNVLRDIGGEHEMVSQPRFSRDGTKLAYISSADGFLTPMILDDPLAGTPSSLGDGKFDYGDVDLGFGQASFCWSDDDAGIYAQRRENGFGRLVYFEIANPRVPIEVAKGFFDAPTSVGSSLIGIRAGARTPTHIAVIDTASHQPSARFARRRIATGHFLAAELAYLSEPEIHRTLTPSIKSGNAGFAPSEIVSRLYRTSHPEAVGTLVMVHGGPTGQTEVRFNHRIAYYTSIGIDVLVPDFRGSSGHGVEFFRALIGGWGVVDLGDVRCAIEQLRQNGTLGSKVITMGGSAGGYLSLLAAQDPRMAIDGAIAVSPVIDLNATAERTHRFEASYTDILVGERPKFEQERARRSPSFDPGSLRCPILVIQGSRDDVVPAEIASNFIDATLAAGKVAKYLLLEGEGHSWKFESSLALETSAIVNFLRDDCNWAL